VTLLAIVAASACALLRPAEIKAVQGEAPVQAVSSPPQSDGPLVVEQCFYRLPDPSRSVSLEVRRAPPAALRERWERMSESDEPGEKRFPPRRVKGIGRRALWVGNAKASALYVLGRRGIVRLSVGGPAGPEAKLAACKSLARRVLRRM
jgi:hypothetical protein